MAGLLETKIYHRPACAVFRKTAERYGGLSNMAGGYPLCVNGLVIPTAEALYQACRYPHRPDIQALILGQASPIAAKMKSKHCYAETRPDWDTVRVPIMAWCLRLKLGQHWQRVSQILLSTGDKPIVEASQRDQFWGAVAVNIDRLQGANVLGCLWTAIRDRRQTAGWSLRQPPSPGGLGIRLLGHTMEEMGGVTQPAATPQEPYQLAWDLGGQGGRRQNFDSARHSFDSNGARRQHLAIHLDTLGRVDLDSDVTRLPVEEWLGVSITPHNAGGDRDKRPQIATADDNDVQQTVADANRRGERPAWSP